jgi:acetyl-CoA carboxylase biotin carboxyl carrier protein
MPLASSRDRVGCKVRATREAVLDLNKLGALIALLKTEEIHEFEHETEAERVRIVRGRPVEVHAVEAVARASVAPAAPAPSATPPVDGVDVTSPFVGTFYRSPGPDAKPFVDVGTSVRVGQTLCIIEAMKLMNEIECELAGTVAEVYVKNGQAVEFGQRLFRIKKG